MACARLHTAVVRVICEVIASRVSGVGIRGDNYLTIQKVMSLSPVTDQGPDG